MQNEYESAASCWSRLHGIRQALITRVERYAALTIPKVCLPQGFQVESMDQTHDYQSLGAQAVNHVVSKLAVAMFAPSRPFFRVTEGKSTKAEAAQAGINETDIGEVLSGMEREGARQLDIHGQRPKIYQALRHLVVTGNVLMILDKGVIRVMGLKYFCVKRTHDGKVHTLIIREEMCFNELDVKVQKLFAPGNHKGNDKVSLYKHIKRTPEGGYVMSQWVDETRLPKEFSGRWSSDDNFPYRVLAWDLADESDYGTGLVEDYCGDFEALSVMAESIVTGAVIGTEFRWVANPNGMTSIEDFRNSRNGDTIPGNAKDINAISPPVADGVKMAQLISADYTQRISRGFLLGSAVTRNAERVTAEEIRLTALELESAFGGVYSALAPSLQRPVALWMLANADLAIGGTDFSVIILTGLDALSRNGDLENLRQGMMILSEMQNAPPSLVERIKWGDLAKFVGQAVGIQLERFIMGEEEFQQNVTNQMARQGAMNAAEAGATASATASTQPPM